MVKLRNNIQKIIGCTVKYELFTTKVTYITKMLFIYSDTVIHNNHSSKKIVIAQS